MASKNLILLSLILAPLSTFGEVAADYVHRGAQQYIFGHDDDAEAAVTAGLTKFPSDPELQQMAGLFRKKKDNQSQGGGNKKQNQQNQEQQNQQQQNQQQQDQQQQNQQQQQPDQSGNGEDQKSGKNQDQSKANNSQNSGENKDRQQDFGASPTPSPSDGDLKSNHPSSSPGNGEKSPTPSDMGFENPVPSPADGQGEQGSPSPTPSVAPQKKLTGEVKGAPGGTQNKTAQAAESDFIKEGQMSPEQAEQLLQSMKDEEARVQLDERKAARHVYNDW